MANQNPRQLEKGFVNIRPSFVAHAQAAQVMQPGAGALDHPATLAQTTAVRDTALGQKRLDATPSQLNSVSLQA